MTCWTLEQHDAVATLRITRPPDNQLSVAGLRELDRKLREVEQDDSIRVVVIASGVPGYFIAHGDLQDIGAASTGAEQDDTLEQWTWTLMRLESLRQPTVAAIDGQAWGGGLELALACTFRLATVESRLAQHEVSRGAMPGAGGTQRLPTTVGIATAAELVLFSKVVDGPTAEDLGLIHQVLPADGFEDQVHEWVAPLAAASPAALQAAKRALVEGLRLPRREGLALEHRLFRDLVRSDAFPLPASK